jgi:glycosyltransferase involved in cell wall biosynthesis
MKRIAIGISVTEGAERLEQTLSAMRANTAESVKVSLLVDAHANVTETVLASHGIPRCISSRVAGAPACFNRLVGDAADVFIFLESGSLVSPGWLEALLAALDAEPRNGLAGPSTNLAWNEQAAFPRGGGTPSEIACIAAEAARRFGRETRPLEPLHSLADFCYAVRREVIESIGLADEGYGLGPCWEMDYNIRAARAGWRGVWACGAYVYRQPFTIRRSNDERRLFEASKHRYQDKFCGARLRREKTDYRLHCRGDACPNFAPTSLIRIKEPPVSPGASSSAQNTVVADIAVAFEAPPLVTCIMPTCDRHQFALGAIRYLLRQDYPNLEIVIVDDGAAAVAPLLPQDSRFRLIRLPGKKNVGAKRNIACAAARGEFIIHWDDDDWYPSDRVTRQIEALREGHADICGTSTLFYHDARSGPAWRYCYKGSGRAWVAGNTLAYRRSCWTVHPFPEIQVGEDSRFVWADPRAKLRDLNDPNLCVARIHANNTSLKVLTGACWQPCAVVQIESLLGHEWSAFVAASQEPRLGTRLPLVSCIMPTFNRRHFLPLALKAFDSQDYPAKELIVVDDGTQPVGDLVEKVPAARYIRLPARASIGEKRNRACKEARGLIIAHWDDDDWYASARLSRQIAPLLNGEAELTGLENSFVLELSARRFWRTSQSLHRRMFVGDIHGGTLVYWKRLFDEGLRYPPSNIAEDAALIQSATRRGRRLVRVPNDGLFVYVRHGGNAWHFEAGHFLDPEGWELISSPRGFSATDLAALQQAATAS